MVELAPPPIPPGFLTRWCTSLAMYSESPPGAFLPTGLALLSASVGPRLVMRWGVAHEERMNLWVLNVGMSALARKTSGLAGLRRAVGWMREEAGDLVRMLSVSRISDAGLVASLDVVGEETARAQATHEAETPKADWQSVPEVVRAVPLSWLALFNEVAPVWLEDGPGWAMDAQRALLSIYDGHLSSTTRATKVPAQECFVTAIGNIPPGVLREQTTLGMLASGFVGRWLVVPTPPPTRIVSFPTPNGIDPLKALREDVSALTRLARLDDKHYVNGLWTDEAKESRHAWYTRYRERFAALDPDDALSVGEAELFGRLQATALKVATLLAVGRQVGEAGSLDQVRVELEDVQWSSKVIDDSIAYVTAAMRDAGAEASSTVGKAEGRVLRYLEREGAVTQDRALTLTDVSHATKGGPVSRADVIRTVETLMATGLVAVEERGRGRRVWLVSGS